MFKKKYDSDDTLNTFKTRLTTKEFKKKRIRYNSKLSTIASLNYSRPFIFVMLR